jgi:hypothetical protein
MSRTWPLRFCGLRLPPKMAIVRQRTLSHAKRSGGLDLGSPPNSRRRLASREAAAEASPTAAAQRFGPLLQRAANEAVE